ncbi:MAG: DUF721 domain-containing protein [Chitinophagaceae bacterium]|nr:DUF721 domain-containing protein [Chitinophagaceae bacterium]
MAEYSIKEALELMLENSNWKNNFYQTKIKENWIMLVGITASNYTDSIKLYQDKLYLKTNVSSLKNEWALNKNILIQKINSLLEKEIITEIILS